MPERKVDQQC